jgi:polyisoprenoid-binding protein YceI
MARYDQTTAECLVLTFKEGLLSPIAHDLKLRFGSFWLEVDVAAATLVAEFDTASLRVVTAMKDGAPNPHALSAADVDKIAEQIRADVLESRRFPKATFRARTLSARDAGGYAFEGELSLHGASRPLRGQSEVVAGRQVFETKLHQPDFGITPFRAMLGTLKIQADVLVRLTV